MALAGCSLAYAAQQLKGRELYALAEEFEKKGDVVNAYLYYSRAAAASPDDKRAWAKSLALRTRAATLAKVMPPVAPAVASLLGESAAPGDAVPPRTEELAEGPRRLEPPVDLQPDRGGPRNFKLRGDSRALWEQVLKAYGLEVIFDADYQPLPNIKFDVESVEYEDALYALSLATASFHTAISEKIVLVARDTTQKRAEVEGTALIEVPIPEPLSVQEAVELSRVVQQALDITKYTVNTTQRVVLFRDRVSKLGPAVALFRELASMRPDVMIELEFVSVARNKTYNFGVPAPASTMAYFLGNFGKLRMSYPGIPANLATFGGGASLFGIAIGGTQLLAEENRSAVNSIFRTKLRMAEGLQATFHVGDRYPILTQGFFGLPSGSAPLPSSFTFEDLGVVLKFQARVHDAQELTIGLEAELKTLAGQGVNGIPIISNRRFLEQVRLRFDQSIVISGLLSDSQTRTIAGLAGFINIPIVGPIFSRNTHSDEQTEALVIIKPRLLHLPPSERATRFIWTGTETRPRPVL